MGYVSESNSISLHFPLHFSLHFFSCESGPWSHTFKDIDKIVPANLVGGLELLSFKFRQDKEGDGCNGIVVSHGPAHVEQRKFFSSYLATTKPSWDDVIGDEVGLFCDQLSARLDKGDRPVPNTHNLPSLVRNWLAPFPFSAVAISCSKQSPKNGSYGAW